MRKSLTLLLVAYAVTAPAGTVFATSENSEHSSFTRPYKVPMNPDYNSAKRKDSEGSFVGTTDTGAAQTRPYKKPMNSWFDSPRWKDDKVAYTVTTATNVQTRPYKKPMNSWYDSPRRKDE